MNPTNLGYQPMDRILKAIEEVDFWANELTQSIKEYENAKEKHYPNVDSLEANMNNIRTALVGWAIEYNNIWGKQ